MPRLVERIQAASASSITGSAAKSCVTTTTTTDQFVITSFDDGANNNNTNIDHLGLTNNPNGYVSNVVTRENSSLEVSPGSELTDYRMSSEVGKIETSQNLAGPQIMSPSQNYLDDKSGLQNGGLAVMQEEQSYPNLFENVNGMIPSYSDSFWNIGSHEDFWLLQQQQQQQLLNNGSFWIDNIIIYKGKEYSEVD